MKKIKAENTVYNILSIVFGGIGIVFTFIGALFLVFSLRTLQGAFPILAVVFLPIGILFLFVTIILQMVAAGRTKKLRVLIAEGYYVMAVFTRTEYDYRVAVNYRNPQRAYCRYTDEYGTVHEFRSVCFWKPLPEEVYVEPTEVPVYMRRGDFSTYYVDIASLMDNEEQVKKHY